jgi:type 1 fimbriae regulatory protein FimB
MTHLSKPELLRLLGAARAYRERDFLMILVGFWHGLRASEVISLRLKDIRDGFLTVKRLKGSLKTVQPLVGHEDPLLDEKKALTDYVVGMHLNQFLFPVGRRAFWSIVVKHARAAGIPKHLGHPHALKHTIAHQIIESAGIENTRQWLGHKSISSTGEYLRVTDDKAGAAVMLALGGRPN